MRINKKDIVDSVNRKIDGTFTKLAINDVITIMVEYIADQLENNQNVSIENFGTFSIYKFHGHDGMDISSGATQYVEEFRSIKFRPHHNFLNLIQKKASKKDR